MQVVSRRTLIASWEKHPKAEAPLSNWFVAVRAAEWRSPQDIRNDFSSADFIGDDRVIFNIGGNNYRLIAHVSDTYKSLLIKFVGTHAEYDSIDPETV
ncbi:type II toxin-antitoxin system HigB family toxin [Mesorhizobium yinganensis]|uniref:type II toxin-antitoxin system HigB family toxin n=1 Tax=Mesorhizobium yinganensis TaxID=3157707 RepID=UPI0032B838DB